jgi:uncharacterized membrane protein YfhO
MLGNELTVSSAPSNSSEVTFTVYGPNEIVAQVNATQDGYLILSEMYAPGWHAYIDGQVVSILRANQLLRAVPIVAGTHQFRMIYDPLTFKLGAIISGVTLLLTLGALLWLWRQPD